MRRLIKMMGFCFIDIVLLALSIVFSYALKFDFNFIYIRRSYWLDILCIIPLAIIIKILCFWSFKLYTTLWKYASLHEALKIGQAVLAGNILVILIALVLPIKSSFSALIISSFLDFVFVAGIRFVYRLYWSMLKNKFNSHFYSNKNLKEKRLMIIGAGEAGSVIVKELESSPCLHSKAVVIIDDDENKIGKKLHGVPILGNRNDIVRLAEEKKIDEIIIAIPSAPGSEINKIFAECSKTKCKVRILPSLSQLIDGKVSINKVRDVQLEDLLGREPVKVDLENIALYLKDKVVLVTGGGGSIGSELCRQIAAFSPKRLLILDNYENGAYDIMNELIFKFPELKLKVLIANIREKQRMESIFKTYRPNVVFHAAAHKHVPLMEENPSEAIKNNVFGTLNLVECSDKYGVSKFILISTDKAVNPTNIMGATKRIAEMLIQAADRYSKTDFAAVRFGNVLGSNGSVVPLFKKQIENGGPVTVTHPEVTRFFMTIPEAVQLVIQAGAMAKGGEIFVLDMGKPVKILDLAKNLIRLSGYKPDEDIKIVFTGLRPGEKLYEELLLEEEGLKATKHDKIFVAKPIFTDFAVLKRELDILYDLLTKEDEEILNYIPNIVPAYTRTSS
ncbi:MAG TPA: polysaccharide biosynthesis protein [Clostridiaceae bacterium]|nr:polysaccharide biosynthesis protein [Clostridiaceae bacterium]